MKTAALVWMKWTVTHVNVRQISPEHSVKLVGTLVFTITIMVNCKHAFTYNIIYKYV